MLSDANNLSCLEYYAGKATQNFLTCSLDDHGPCWGVNVSVVHFDLYASSYAFLQELFKDSSSEFTRLIPNSSISQEAVPICSFISPEEMHCRSASKRVIPMTVTRLSWQVCSDEIKHWWERKLLWRSSL